MNTGFIWGIRSRNGKESKNNLNTANARRSRKSKGFTLVELIVVLVILAILAAIAVPTFIAFIDKGKEKEIEAAGEKALAATQTALSDIYADGSSRFSIAKREATRTLAAVDNDKNNSDTSFTVWNEQKLWDGKTVAIAKNIGSYTVSKALYREGEKYAAYDGTEWTIFDSEDTAMAKLNLSSTDEENVIYVWPYKQDFAYLDGSIPDDPDETDPSKKSSVKVVTFKLPANTLSHVFFSLDGRTSNSGKDSVKVVFWKDTDGNISSYWTINGEGVSKFRVDDNHTYWVNVVNTASNSYELQGWQPEGSDIITLDKSILQNYIFVSNQNQFTFTGVVKSDEIITQVATLDKAKTKALIGGSTLTGMQKVTGGPAGSYDSPAMVQSIEGSARIDMGLQGEGGQIWGWISEGQLKWWTDATTVYLPDDCSDFFNSATKVANVDFSEFDAAKITTMSSMFAGNDALQSVKFGNNFHAGSLTNTSNMFNGCTVLTSLSDLEKFNAEEGTLLDTSHMFEGCKAITSISFGDGFDTTNVTTMQSMFRGCEAATTINVSGLTPTVVADASYIFNDCKNVGSLDLRNWDFGSVTTLDKAFSGCERLATLNSDTWTLNNCRYMNYAFENCHSLNNDFHNITITESNLEQMEGVFAGCSASSTFDVKNWNTSKVENMKYIFLGCSNATTIDVSHWNMNSVKLLDKAFYGCSKLTTLNVNLDSNNVWNLPECNSLESTFQNCSVDTALPKIKTTNKLTNMKATYSGCSKLKNVDLSAMNPAAITTMAETFNGCTDLEKVNFGTAWNLQACTNFGSTFAGCSKLNQDFREMTVNATATDIHGMFRGCSGLAKLNLRSWNTTHVTNCASAFESCGNLRRIYATDNCTLVQSTTSTDTFKNCTKIIGEKGTTYDAGNVSGTYGWIDGHIRDGEAKEGYFSYKLMARMKAENEGWVYHNVLYGGKPITKANYLSFRHVTDSSLTEEIVKAKNGCTDQLTDPTFTEGYPVYFWLEQNGTGYDVCWWSEADFLIINQGMEQMFLNWTAANINLADLDFSEVRDMSEFFQNAQKLECASFTLSNATNFENMFSGCKKLATVELNINTPSGSSGVSAANMFSGDTVLSSVTVNANGNFSSLEGMFKGCTNLTDLSGIAIDTSDSASGVTLKNMFYGCTGLVNADMTSGNLVNVTSLEGLFNGCTQMTDLTLDVSTKSGSTNVSITDLFTNTGNLANVTITGSGEGIASTANLFKNRAALRTVDMSGFELSTIRSLDSMFIGSTGLTSAKLNVDSSNSETGVPMANMFNGDKALTEVSITGDGSNISSTYRMFYGASAITAVDLSGFTFGKTSNMTEMFRDCTSLQSAGLSVDTSENTLGCSLSNLFKGDTDLTEVNLTVSGGKISSLESTFSGCTSLTGLPNVTIDTSESTAGLSVKNMFTGCTGFVNVSLDHLHLENVTTMEAMFSYCSNVKNLSFYVSTLPGSTSVSIKDLFTSDSNLENLTMAGSGEGITSTASMFSGRTSLKTVNMADFELKSITNLEAMFTGCTGLTSASLRIDTSGSSNDVSMKNMFYNNSSLTNATITGNWSKVSNLESMFERCKNLTSLDFGDAPDMSNLKNIYKMLLLSDRNGVDNVFNAFAGTYQKWDMKENDIFEYRLGTNTRIKIGGEYATKISGKDVGLYAGKTAERNGNIYEVQDNKYFYLQGGPRR